jgi:hypothetical protein
MYDSSQQQNYRSVFKLAISKLLSAPDERELNFTVHQQCAVLSQRLALEINSATYIISGSTRNYDMSHKLQTQIASHMRVCMAIPKDLTSTVHGIAASEPVLSEAASLIMRTYNHFDLSQALLDVLDSFAIDHGERGELVVAALFMRARDLYISQKQPSLFPNDLSRFCPVFSVKDLLSYLFKGESLETMLKSLPSVCRTDFPSQLRSLKFGDVFKNTYMHFNHLIKLFQQKVIMRQYLLGIMARGAAALGANNQQGYDMVYPFLYGTGNLVIENVGFIIVQVKNHADNMTPSSGLFKAMDPFVCKLLSADDDSSDFTVPIIRIVFYLGGENTGLKHMKHEPHSDGAQTLDAAGRSMFTSYDFWCSGIDPGVLRPVEEKKLLNWKQLLGKTDKWGGLFSASSAPDVRCSQYPGGGTDKYHYEAWMKSDHIPAWK